jgi:hypothetical protein
VDLSEVKGLDAVHHMTPIEISLSTLTASRFKLSPAFRANFTAALRLSPERRLRQIYHSEAGRRRKE